MTESHTHRDAAPQDSAQPGDLTGPQLEDVVSRVLARARSRAEAPLAAAGSHPADGDVAVTESGARTSREHLGLSLIHI